MKVRSVKVRALLLLPVIAVAGIGLTACDSKAGTAAVVNGTKISESRLNDYLGANPTPIPQSTGASISARLVVLRALVNNVVAPRLLQATGGPASAADLLKIKAQIVAQTSEQQLTAELDKLGLKAAFVKEYLLEQEMFGVLQGRLASQADLANAAKKADIKVSVSPRYGTWDATNLGVLDLSKNHLPSFLTLTDPLPGDATATASK